MSKARNLARLIVDGNGDVDTTALGNVPPSDDASALTTGTLDIARIGDGTVSAAKLATGAAVSNIGFTPANSASLSSVATSGSYTDLISKPIIPTAVSQLTNDSGYTTNTGTVTSVGGTGSYGGLSLSGTVTSSGNLTFGGTPSGTWPISISGNAATASNGGVTSVNGQTGAVTVSTGAPTTAQVLSATAGLTITSKLAPVGAYALLIWRGSSTTFVIGNTAAGSSLQTVNANGNNDDNQTGTWRCMGYSESSGAGAQSVTLWIRIS